MKKLSLQPIQENPFNVGVTEHGAMSAHDALREGGGDFNVYYAPAGFKPQGGYNSPGGWRSVKHQTSKGEVNSNYYVVREDTHQPLGLHSNRYPQYKGYHHIADMIEELFPMSTTGVKLINNGQRIIFTQQLHEEIDLGDGDIIKPKVIWIDSFNGKWGTGCYSVMDRLFCMNQLIDRNMLLKVRHTKNHEIRLNNRKHILHESLMTAKKMERIARILKDTEYTTREFNKLVETICPKQYGYWSNQEVSVDTWVANTRAINVQQREHEAMLKYWNRETRNFSKNKWCAYNSVQSAEQHDINTGHKNSALAIENGIIKNIDGKGKGYAEKAKELLLAGVDVGN